MEKQIQINNLQGQRVKIYLKNGDTLYGTLTFFNYNEQVIHLKDFALERDGRIVENGKFWVVNSRAWYNLVINEEVESK